MADILNRPKVAPVIGRIDKTVLRLRPEATGAKPRKKQRALPGPRKGLGRHTVDENPKHRYWISGQPCAVPGCQHPDVQAAHVTLERHAKSMTTPDEMTIPLCVAGARGHHDECDANQPAFAAKYDMDLVAMAKSYAKESPHA